MLTQLLEGTANNWDIFQQLVDGKEKLKQGHWFYMGVQTQSTQTLTLRTTWLCRMQEALDGSKCLTGMSDSGTFKGYGKIENRNLWRRMEPRSKQPMRMIKLGDFIVRCSGLDHAYVAGSSHFCSSHFTHFKTTSKTWSSQSSWFLVLTCNLVWNKQDRLEKSLTWKHCVNSRVCVSYKSDSKWSQYQKHPT